MVSFDSIEPESNIRYIPWTYVMGSETVERTIQILKYINKKWNRKFEVLDIFFDDEYVCFKLGTCKLFHKHVVDPENWPPGVKLNFYHILKKTSIEFN